MIETIDKCPECGLRNLVWNKKKGEVICRYCGLVIDDKLIDFGPEWQEFDEKDAEKRRAGEPITYLKPGLTTQVGKDADLYKLSDKTRNKFFRLKKWQRRTATALERNLNLALAELSNIASALNLPSAAEEEAARIYTLALQRGLIKGRGIEKMVAGAIHVACKICEVPKTLKEISEATNIDKNDIARAYRFITRNLDVKVLPSDPISFVNKFASALKLSPKTETKAVKIIEIARKKRLLSGKNPSSIAAAALYVASLLNKERRTQQKFSEVANITEVTLRNRAQELIVNLKLKLSKRRK